MPVLRAAATGCEARCDIAAARLARCTLSPSLVDRNHVGSSTRPFLIPCNSSRRPAHQRQKKSVMSLTTVSDCPMPTVSTSITSSRPLHRAASLRVLRRRRPSRGRRWRGAYRHGRSRQAAPCASCRRGSSRRCAPKTGRPENPNLVAALDQGHPERIDGGTCRRRASPVMPTRIGLPVAGSSACTKSRRG